jgi:serine protease AprX
LKQISEKMRRAFTIIAFFSLALSLTGQVAPGKYFVEFTDKNNNTFSIDRPWEFLSQRALDRRVAQGIAVTETDLPVTPDYVAGVAAVGVWPTVRVKWLNGLIFACADTTLIPLVEALPYVEKVVKSGPGNQPASDKFEMEIRSVTLVEPTHGNVLKNTLSYDYGQSYNQIAMLNGDKLHEEGYRGQGKVIAVLDAGFEGTNTIRTFDSLRDNGQILGSRDFVSPGGTVYGHHPHGTMVLSTMGANLPGELIGTAPMAGYWLLRTEDGDSEYIIEEYNWVAGAAYADSVGADVINSSLGYTDFNDPSQNHTCDDMTGNTTPVTKGANIAAQRGMVVVNSAGNSGGSGWMCVGAPADGTDVLAVAAVDSNGNYASFSSWGLIDGSYVKPNVAAQGALTVVSWTDGTIVRSNGTSFSSPVTAGMVASLWSARPGLSATDLRRMIEQSGSQYNNPDTLLGYGIPDFFMILGEEGLGSPKAAQAKVYPNPFNRSVTLTLTTGKETGLVAVLWSVRGERVFTSTPLACKKGENRFELSLPGSLNNGLYLLQIYSPEDGLTVSTVKIEKR